MKILDTDILVGILRKNMDAITKYEHLQKETIFTTVFNAQELIFGALISDNESNFKTAKDLVNELRMLDYNEADMAESVRIQADFERNGRHIGLIDEMIAGICIANNATIVTRNIKHFSRISNLKTEIW